MKRDLCYFVYAMYFGYQIYIYIYIDMCACVYVCGCVCVYNFTINQCIIIIIVIPEMYEYLLEKGFCIGKCDKINVFTSHVAVASAE